LRADLNNAVTKEYYVQYAEALISYLLDRDAAIKRIINSPVRSTFFDIFLHQNYEDTKRRLEASVVGGMKLFSTADVVASMIVGGTAHCIIKWFDSEQRCPVSVLLSDISKFIDKLLD